ncbi:MAG: DUF1444 family protein, partial [Bacilli bacterium]
MKEKTIEQFIQALRNQLGDEHYHFYVDEENDVCRVVRNEGEKGVSLGISKSLAKFHQKGEAFVTDIVYYLKESLRSMNEQQQSNTFYPVLKAHSFPTTANGETLVFDEHTAETRIFYAQDFGNTYKLVTEPDLKKMKKTKEELVQMAAFSLRSLDYRYRKDEVAGNVFYFVSARDGYDASKLLNRSFIKTLTADFEGTAAVSIPHQDVLSVAE